LARCKARDRAKADLHHGTCAPLAALRSDPQRIKKDRAPHEGPAALHIIRIFFVVPAGVLCKGRLGDSPVKTTTLPATPVVAEQAAMLSRSSTITCLVGMGFDRPIFTAPRIATPLWYEYHLLEEDPEFRERRGDWPCLLLLRSRCMTLIWFCTISGHWMARTAKGSGIIQLAGYLWETDQYTAARRIFDILDWEERHAA